MLSLKKRSVRAGSWVLFGHLLSQCIRLLGNLVLTRLLVPEMFGVMAIVSTLVIGVTVFFEVGLLQNIVRSKRGEEKDFLDTAWTLQIIKGAVVFAVILLLSFALDVAGNYGFLSEQAVYGAQELPLILAIIGSTSIISGFNSIYIYTLNKKLMMAKVVSIELVSQVVGLVFMLLWAYFSKDIWALVSGSIVTALTKMTLSHLTKLGPKARFFWEKEAVLEIFNFGKWIFVASILGFLLNQGDRLLLAGLVSADVLGVYAIGFFLANALKEVLSKLLSSVFFPLLTEVYHNSPTEVEKVYYLIRMKIDIVTMPTAGFLFSVGGYFLTILYDSRYQEAVWMFEVLSLSLVTLGFMLSDQLLLAFGRAKYMTLSIFIQVIALYTFVPLAFNYFGLVGAVWAIALNPILKIFVMMFVMKRVCFLNISREIVFFPLILVGFFSGEFLKYFFTG